MERPLGLCRHNVTFDAMMILRAPLPHAQHIIGRLQSTRRISSVIGPFIGSRAPGIRVRLTLEARSPGVTTVGTPLPP